jgi:putative zinc finger/helix-turn-helix YgiT family protein
MTHESAGPVRSRPFPWKCPNCREAAVYPERMLFRTEAKHDGRTYPLEIPDLEVPRCRECGEKVISHAVDDAVVQALRDHLHLLTPQQIRERREALGLTGTKLAERLGVAQETISRWETGALIQSRAMDNLLRIYFAIPEVRAALRGPDQDPKLGLDGGVGTSSAKERLAPETLPEAG